MEILTVTINGNILSVNSLITWGPGSGLSKVAGCRRKSLPTWLVSASYSARHFPYGWRFLSKISLDWLLTLTTQPSTSKLSDNPEVHYEL